MNQEDVNNKTSDINQIRSVIDRLKTLAKNKYAKDREEVQAHNIELDESYLRGFYFGQLAALEDCYHLIAALLDSLQKTSKNDVAKITKDFNLLISMVEILVAKIEMNDNITEHTGYIKEYLETLKTVVLK